MSYTAPSTSTWQPQRRAKNFSIHTVWIAIRCWWYIAMPIGLLLAAGVAAWLIQNHYDTWTATATLEIKDRPDVVLRDVQLDSRRFLQNQLAIMKSPRILGALVSNKDILSAPELSGAKDPVRVIAAGLRIRQQMQSDLYEVSYTGRSAASAQRIIEEVVSSYLTYNRKLQSEEDNGRLALLEEQRAARYEEMNQLRENVRTLSIQLTGVDPFRVITEEDKVKSQSLLESLRGEVIRYQVQQDILAEQIRREEESQTAQDVELSQVEVDVQLRSQPGYITLQSRIEALQRREDDYLKTTKKDESNAALKQVRSELAGARESLEKYKTEARSEIEESLKKQLLATRAEKLSIMRNNFVAGDARLKVLKDKLADEEQARAEAGKPPGYSLELEARKARLEQVTEYHNELQMRILAIKTEQKAPDRVKLLVPAELPKESDKHSLWLKIATGMGIAFCLPLGLVLLWEHVYRRVNNRHDIEENQHIPVIGEVTALPTRKRKTPLRQRGSERDFSLFEESVESVRTCLSLMSSLRDVQTLAVMSAVSGEGKTSLAAQLAVCIARASDQRTLLIDGDMRWPDMHGIFQVDPAPGLAELLAAECPAGEAIEMGVAKNLDLIVAGKLRCSPHQLLNATDFPGLLAKLKKHYRFIVIDTPPILPASESLVMARAADAAVLCMRRDHSRVDQSQDAYGRMLAAGVKVAGAVLNGISTRQYYYRYGNYTYRLNSSGKDSPSGKESAPRDQHPARESGASRENNSAPRPAEARAADVRPATPPPPKSEPSRSERPVRQA